MLKYASVALLLSCLINGAPAADPDKAAIDLIFEKWKKPDAPGCAYAVAREDRIVLRDAFGLANLETGTPLTVDSVFNIGSISKQFTAASVVLLAQRGKLSLDDDVRKHVPEVPDFGKTITLRHLLTHSSGLRDTGTLMQLAGRPHDNTYSEREWLKLVSDQKRLNNPAGERYEYVNTGYFLLGVVVKRVSGQSLRKFAQENIFGPLGMSRTHVHDSRGEVVRGRAAPYHPVGADYGFALPTSEVVGSTGVMSTVEDLLRWGQNFQHNRLSEGPQFVSALDTPGRLNDGSTSPYALGQFVMKWKGLNLIQHGGWDGGYKSVLMRFPDQKLTVDVLCNNMGIEPTFPAYELAHLYLKDFIPSEPAGPATSITPAQDDDSDRLLSRYISQDGLRIRRIERRQGKLFYVRGQGNESELVPVGNTRYRMLPVSSGAELQFEAANASQPAYIIVTAPGQPTVVLDAYSPQRYSKEEFGAFTGKFNSDEFAANVSVTFKDGKLFAQGGGIPQQELVAVTADLFTLRIGGTPAQIRFERDKAGAVERLRLDLDRAQKLYFVREDRGS